MSDCERFTQIAQAKWATVSKSLRSLMINEQMSDSLNKFLLKKYKILFFSMFYIGFFILKNERFAHSLIFGERCERIAQVAHQKWAMWANRSGRSPKMSDVSKLLRSLTKNERCERMSELLKSLTKNERMGESLVFWANCSFALFCKKQAIRSEKWWANSQPWLNSVYTRIDSYSSMSIMDQLYNFDRNNIFKMFNMVNTPG